MVRSSGSWTLALLAALALAQACADDGGSGTDARPDAAEPRTLCTHKDADGDCIGVTKGDICVEAFCTSGASCSRTFFVDDDAGGGGDGSSGKPLATLPAAAAKAAAGDCIALAAGSYKGAKLAGGVSLLGRGAAAVTVTGSAAQGLAVGAGQGGLLRGVTLTGAGKGLTLSGIKGLRLEQLQVSAASDVGIDARKSTGLVLDHVLVEKTKPGKKGDGVGLLLADGSTAAGDGLVAADNQGIGVQVDESSIRLSGSVVARCGSFGLSIQCSADPGCQGALASEVAGSRITRGALAGVWIGGAKAVLKKVEIDLTKGGAGIHGRGIDVSGGAQVEVRDSRVHDNDDQGIVLDASVGLLVGNRVEDNGERGIWAQDKGQDPKRPCKLTAQKNVVKDNALAGIGGLGCASLAISGGTVSGTKEQWIAAAQPYAVGDGVQLLQSAQVQLDGVKLAQNKRAGVLLDASKGAVKNNVIDGSQHPLVTQKTSPGDVTVSNNATAAGTPVQATVPTTELGLSKVVDLISINPIPLP